MILKVNITNAHIIKLYIYIHIYIYIMYNSALRTFKVFNSCWILADTLVTAWASETFRDMYMWVVAYSTV